MSRQRIFYIDVIKIFSVFFVVWLHLVYKFGHNVLHDIIFAFFHSFLMPLFAFVSGYFFNTKRGLVGGISNKFVSLGIPLVFWSIIVTVLSIFFIEEIQEVHLMAIIRNLYYYVAKWHLWFIRALLLSFVVAFLSISIYDNKYISLPISYFILQFFFLLGIIPEDNPVVELNGFIFLYPFLVLGAIYKDFETIIEKYEKKIIFICLILYVPCFCLWKIDYTFYHTRLSMYSNETSISLDWYLLYIIFFRLFIGIIAISVFILLLKRFNNFFSKYNSIIESFSNATLCIYIVHSLFLNLIEFPDFSYITGIAAFVVVLFVTFLFFIICYLIYIVTCRNKLLKLIFWGQR